jgi:hypothetical protein
MFEQAPEWISRSPRIRKVIVKIWRCFLRVQRSTLAQAVLIARRQDNCVLAVAAPSGELRLPCLELDGWKPIGAQVQTWVESMGRRASMPQLQGVDGTPGRRGVTFLYSAQLDVRPSPGEGYTWLAAELAPSALLDGDRRLLLLGSRKPPSAQ